MKSFIPLQFVVLFIITTLCHGAENRLTNSVAVSTPPYKIAGPSAGVIPQPSAPQTNIGGQIGIPGLPASVGLQFNNWAFSTYLAIAYSTVVPAFLWLTGTSRTPLMKAWYSTFNVGFIFFGIVLKISLDNELPLWACALLPLALGALGMFIGFRWPNGSFLISLLWSSFLLVNILHIIFGATESTHYLGLGNASAALYPLTLAIFFLYLLIESKYFHSAQNLTCSFSSAYCAIAGISFLLYFYFHSLGVQNSPFDVVSFIGLPIQFRWDSPLSVTLLVCWMLATIVGFSFATYRDFLQGASAGFFEGGKGSLAALIELAKTGSVKTEGTSTGSETKQPLLTFGGSLSFERSRKSRNVDLFENAASYESEMTKTTGLVDLDFSEVDYEVGFTTTRSQKESIQLPTAALDDFVTMGQAQQTYEFIINEEPYYSSPFQYAMVTTLPEDLATGVIATA